MVCIHSGFLIYAFTQRAIYIGNNRVIIHLITIYHLTEPGLPETPPASYLTIHLNYK